MNNHKDMIRKSILEKRNLLLKEEVEQKSLTIIERIMETEAFKSCKSMMCYVDFKNEVKTQDFIRYAINAGKKVSVPYIVKSPEGRKHMVASQLIDFDQDLAEGNFGILEPVRNAVRVVTAREIDLVIIPGVAFDLNKHRIGFGAGFYDRFLKDIASSCLKIGIAYGFQVVEQVPPDAHDIPVDMLITEDRVII